MKRNILILFLLIFADLQSQVISLTPPLGSVSFGYKVKKMPNGNILVLDPEFNNGALSNVGAVYMYDGVSDKLLSKVVGSQMNDKVGLDIIFLANDNFLIKSNIGLTWCSANAMLPNAISTANTFTFTGNPEIKPLKNGNYLLIDNYWNNGYGAVTWLNGNLPTSGTVNSTNSLIGVNVSDRVGELGVTELPNGDYVVISPRALVVGAPTVGAVTHGHGDTGTFGFLTLSNSLVAYTQQKITVLKNGNYVVVLTGSFGGATLCDGNTGRVGLVDSTNSLLGSNINDYVGDRGVTALENGHYVVCSSRWQNGGVAVGAITWCNGVSGGIGYVSTSNSWIGVATDDLETVTVNPLTNGNFVINCPHFSGISGTVTWVNGSNSSNGVISSSNSLIGGYIGERVIPLHNGNYVVCSPDWGNAKGAITWCDGTIPTFGIIDSSNSIIGNSLQYFGSTDYRILPLPNGHFVISNYKFSDGPKLNVGMVAWVNGFSPTTGKISSSNALIGSTAGDSIGGYSGAILLKNGNYVVFSPKWDNGIKANVGAITIVNANTGLTGYLNSTNSLIGSSSYDQVGSNYVSDFESVTMQNLASNYLRYTSDYLVGVSPKWNYGLIQDVGALTYMSINNPKVGEINPCNSVLDKSSYVQVNEKKGNVILHDYGKVKLINVTQFLNAMNYPCAFGSIFEDNNNNCIKDSIENILFHTTLCNIQPGNYVAQTINGFWYAFLPPGSYVASMDSSGQWFPNCSPTVNFNLVTTDSIVKTQPIPFRNINACTEPEITMIAPVLRRCFANQIIYLEAKNKDVAYLSMYNSYADVTLDSFLTVTSATRPYTALGNNVYRFQLDSLYPGESKTWTISTTVSCSTSLGQTLCMNAKIFPVSPCVLDSTPTQPSGVSPCLGPWDKSSLKVEGECVGDSVRFVITNTGVFGNGDMDCFMPIRIYVDGALFSLDSLKIVGGDSLVITLAGFGHTWRLEADQHPLHPGNSHPNATVDACGDSSQLAQNWTPGTVNTMPLDDADPVIDIYCGVVSGSYDPNDKTGYPTGVTNNHYILKNQQLQYVIRFQNTGTDTAFTVVIRDTLETDLNIFSVKTGVSSHNYSFRMYGPRVLEWTFNNIMLPDSFHSEPNSHGFVTFTVEQNENLPNGTLIENSAAIYFDFNDPVITNKSQHTITETWPLITSVSDLNNIQQSDIQVYPNPTEDKLHVLSSLPCTIKLLDLTGRLLKNMSDRQTSHELNLSEFPAGIYLLEVEVNGKIEVKKVIRK